MQVVLVTARPKHSAQIRILHAEVIFPLHRLFMPFGRWFGRSAGQRFVAADLLGIVLDF